MVSVISEVSGKPSSTPTDSRACARFCIFEELEDGIRAGGSGWWITDFTDFADRRTAPGLGGVECSSPSSKERAYSSPFTTRDFWGCSHARARDG